ncbi:serine hydrolase [Paenactinomyces guangxiensis]|uniref:Serine hydrolase n=1 Tax=Paenactinomyces guangxiensis TaxID=1490290 RepID=A0A7W1WV20_9BACL|nr:serine hydrolase [Paenactinomyces guangxiensis]MBA4496376.1 serine hydrolase [Paenactinomyces guangxiensis]MBH8593511.1 serine hydrolase [Paenactinomyces guangxiensis]
MSHPFQQLTIQLEKWKKQLPGKWGIWVEDLKTRETWEYNCDHPFFSASVIKVPIMVAVYREAWRDRFALSDEITLPQEAQVGGSGVLQHLSPGMKITIQDLTTLMIIQSDNTATNLLIDLVGKEVINEVMKELGMTKSVFYNPLMIVPVEREGVNTITAADIASCYRKLAQGEAVSYHSSLQMIQTLKKQQIRDCFPSLLPQKDNHLVGTIPNWELAHKTGMVTRVLHDSGILYTGPHALVIVALSEDCSYEIAKQNLGQLAFQVYRAYQKQ